MPVEESEVSYMVRRLKSVRTHSRRLVDYMLSDAAYWYWATVSLTAFTALIVLLPILEGIDLVVYMRHILGSIYVIWFPGYTVVKAISPRSELNTIERIALSLAMSLVSVSLVGLLLTFTPWGISTVPVVLSIFALTVIFASAAVIREYSSARAY